MGDTTKIKWSNMTFNAWLGCVKVSPACAFCYAEREAGRKLYTKEETWGKDAKRHVFSDDYWKKPLRWNAKAEKLGVRFKVFCSSLSDVFENRRDLDALRLRLFALIEKTPNLDWQLLTKRPESIMDLVPESWRAGFPPNVWAMTSAENQEWFDRRWEHLRKVPARVLGLSCEPLLGPIDFGDAFQGRDPKSLWVIAGGESECKANVRASDSAWFYSLRDQCLASQIPFFFKQWGNLRDGVWQADPLENPDLEGVIYQQFPPPMMTATRTAEPIASTETDRAKILSARAHKAWATRRAMQKARQGTETL